MVMTTRIWIGGGNNKASNPKDWSPTGVPRLGDNLFIAGSTGAMPPNGTINVVGNDLAGDTLTAGSIPTQQYCDDQPQSRRNADFGHVGTGNCRYPAVYND
jgi:hypothetical protein